METLEDIVSEIREVVSKYGVKAFGQIMFARGDLADRIEKAAAATEREKRYEYAVEFCEAPEKWEVYMNRLTLVEALKLSSEPWGRPHRIVRREVGEWEEVSQ